MVKMLSIHGCSCELPAAHLLGDADVRTASHGEIGQGLKVRRRHITTVTLPGRRQTLQTGEVGLRSPDGEHSIACQRECAGLLTRVQRVDVFEAAAEVARPWRKDMQKHNCQDRSVCLQKTRRPVDANQLLSAGKRV